MKKVLLTLGIFLIGISAFSQKEEKNGTIYIKHPYITIVENGVKAYLAQDEATLKTYYADTAKYWISGLDKFIPIADAFKAWWATREKYNITMTPMGYPDYLHYVKDDAKVVQSWWIWTAKPKDGGPEVKVYMVMFHDFNKDGKIASQGVYGDFSKIPRE